MSNTKKRTDALMAVFHPPTTPTKPRVIIEIKGGMIINTTANNPDQVIEIIDRDIPESPTDAYRPDIKNDVEMDQMILAADAEAQKFSD